MFREQIADLILACAMLPAVLHVKANQENFDSGANCMESFDRNHRFGIYGQSCITSGHSVLMVASEPLTLPKIIPAGGLTTNVAHTDKSSRRSAKSLRAFTLIEAMIALGVMVLFVAACMSAIVINQLSVRKAREQALAIDFLTKYVETVKALPFDSVAVGLPINSLFNGAGGGPEIEIPANSSWVSVNTTDYQTFYPDLVWFANRNPRLQVILSNISIGGVPAIEINAKLSWDPLLSRGNRQVVVVDFLRTRDVPNL